MTHHTAPSSAEIIFVCCILGGVLVLLAVCILMSAIHHSRLAVEVVSTWNNLRVLCRGQPSVFSPNRSVYTRYYLCALVSIPTLCLMGLILNFLSGPASVCLAIVGALTVFVLRVVADIIQDNWHTFTTMLKIISYLIKKARVDIVPDVTDNTFCSQERRWIDAEVQWEALLSFIDTHTEKDQQKHMPLPLSICSANEPLFDSNRARLLQMRYKLCAHHCESCKYLCLVAMIPGETSYNVY